MSKIVVAGAGHGGLTAAYNLAKAGHEVTVYEKAAYDTVGHDWHDGLWLRDFDLVNMPRPDASLFMPNKDMRFFNPKKSVSLELNFPETSTTVFMDRRRLVQYLIDRCGEAGVSFRFGVTVTNAVCAGDRVRGVCLINENGEKETAFGDLTVDAAGVDSPVRESLPARLGVTTQIPDRDVFFVYRAYYEKLDQTKLDPRYTVYFFHCGHPGMDWMITEEDYMDVLVGQFGGISEETIRESLEDFRKEYPYLGERIVRGGYVSRIPLTRTLPSFVANGYAAVGDSAGMTVPLNGCGIDLSLQAGGILALVAGGIRDGNFTREKLWQYQQRYCVTHGNKLVPVAKLRAFMATLNASNVDFLLEHKILTQTEINMANGNMSAVDLKYILKKAVAIMTQDYMITTGVKAMRGVRHLKKITSSMPAVYVPARVQKWKKLYNAC